MNPDAQSTAPTTESVNWFRAHLGLAIPVVFVAGMIVLAGMVAVVNTGSSTAPLQAGAPLATITTTFDPATQWLGPCSVVTPPVADPCQAAQSFSRYVFWDAMVNASAFVNWKKANPGEWVRLQSHMAAPLCGNGVGLPQDMVTQFGAAMFADVQAYACALGTEPILVPAANPPAKAGAKDRTPPTPPGPVIINP